MTGPMLAPMPDPGGSTPVDEARWNRWLASNAAREIRDAAGWMTGVKLTAIAAVAATMLLWTHVAPYQLPLRFAISICALAALNQSARAKRYALAVLFLAVLIIYNPLYAIFQTASGWPLPVPLFALVAFAASLFWPDSPTRPLTLVGAAERAGVSTWENEGGASRGLDRNLLDETTPRPR